MCMGQLVAKVQVSVMDVYGSAGSEAQVSVMDVYGSAGSETQVTVMSCSIAAFTHYR